MWTTVVFATQKTQLQKGQRHCQGFAHALQRIPELGVPGQARFIHLTAVVIESLGFHNFIMVS